jgi:hypothetical protein
MSAKRTFGAIAAGIVLVGLAAVACTDPVKVPADYGGACAALLTKCGATCTDLQTDPQNCNGCGNACKAGEVCAKGTCQFDCVDGTTKCGDRCNDLQVDAQNCGECGKKCATGLFCAAGKCVARCESAGLATCGPPVADGGTDAASDASSDAADGSTLLVPAGCADLQKDTSNCGACGVKCGGGQVCSNGTCCAAGKIACGGVCVDGSFDNANCGGCGVQCTGGAECLAGSCVTGSRYSETFQNGATPGVQCTNWNTWRAGLTGTYNFIWFKGSLDPVGAWCQGAQANQICQTLRTGGTATVACNGKTWSVGTCTGIELSVGTFCSCAGFPTARPCITNMNWGGMTVSSCSAPTQTLTVICGP